ncbi:hypothetical protein HYW75_04920 [Candidatus Pacearchaeota archaeon]|nr:hypothetical protein [Candidatus Pacearchaeota archaeon]
MRKDSRNLLSLLAGIFLVFIGLTGTIITIPSSKPIIILPVLSLVIGAILAILGGLRKW